LVSTHSASIGCSPIRPAHTIRGYLFIAAAGLWWGISATLGRAAFTGKLLAGGAHPIDPLIIAQTRTTISLLVLVPIMLARRGPQAFRMSRRDLGLSLALGVLGVALSNYFYYLAIQKTNVATAIILQYTAPILVLLYMVARRRQRATPRRVGSVMLAVFGIALTVGIIGPGQFRVSLSGLVVAELAAAAFAYYNVAAGSLLQRYDRWRVLAMALLAAAVFWQIINPPWKVIAAHYSGPEWLFLVGFAITSVLLPFSFYFAGLQCLDATRAIVTSCLEPVFSIAIAAAALGESLGVMQLIGIGVVLIATVAIQLPEAAKRRAAPIAAETVD
jgi:drug/metabolite transporter (DMT)-like permease